MTVLVKKKERATIPTIAIIGGGTGGNLLAARLLQGAASGQRLNVMLIEARGRAGSQLRGIVRQAESMAPGAFLTRLRGEAVGVHDGPGGRAVRVALRSGRVLDADRAVIVLGSVAAAALESLPPDSALSRVHLVPSDGPPEALSAPVEALAARLVSELGAAKPAPAA